MSSLTGWGCIVAGPLFSQAVIFHGAVCIFALGVSMPCPSLGRLSVRLWASLISWALSVAGPLLGQAIFLLGAICLCTFAVSSLTGAALVLGPYLVRLSFSLVLCVGALGVLFAKHLLGQEVC